MDQEKQMLLTTKKQILLAQKELADAKDSLSQEERITRYNNIMEAIEALSSSIKPNTVLQLKNALNAAIGEYKKEIVEKQRQNTFITFFECAYPKGKRRKDFTWVLADWQKISDEQILHTLKYINTWCKDNTLTKQQIADIQIMIDRLVKHKSVKYINQIKSLEGLRKSKSLAKFIKGI